MTASAAVSRGSSILAKCRRVLHIVQRYGGRHRRWFIRGALAALIVVGAKLALPWPLKALLTPWLQSSGEDATHVAWAPLGLDPIIAMAGVFLLLLVLLGLADLLERLYFARFAIAITRDLRAEAFAAVVRTDPRHVETLPGDLVSRLVGDANRAKAGLKGFLVHVATNGALFLGVIAVLLWMDWRIGFVFAIAGLATLAVAVGGARAIFIQSLEFRKEEGRRANAMHEALLPGAGEHSLRHLKASSGYHKATTTRLQGVATWLAHIIYGLAVLLALWLAASAIADGRMNPGHMVVLVMYALMMRGPFVRLSRQGARTGKILAGGERLISLIRTAESFANCSDTAPIPRLARSIRLADVSLDGSKRHGGRPRLARVNLDLRAGQRILVVGGPGSGKTSLLELIGARRSPSTGSLSWDDHDYATISNRAFTERIAFAAQRPLWARATLRETLNLPRELQLPDALELFPHYGLRELLTRLPKGLDTNLGSDDLSGGECRLLGIVRALRQPASIWLFDDPVAGLSATVVAQFLRDIAAINGLVIVASSSMLNSAGFDRLIELDAGHVTFDDSPALWSDRRMSGSATAASASFTRGETR